MLEHRRHILRRLHNFLDAIVTAAIFALIYLLRDNLARIPALGDLSYLAPFEQYAPLMLIASFLWPVFLNYHGLYDPTRLRKAFVNVGIIFRSSLESTIFLVLIIFLFQIETISRFFLIGFGILNASTLVVKDLIRRRYRLHRYLAGRDLRPVLIVATFNLAKEMIQKIKEENYLGLKPVAVVLPDEDPTVKKIDGVPVAGSLENWRDILHANPAAYVIFNLERESISAIEKALSICQEEGVESWVMANFFGLNLPRAAVDYFASSPTLVFRTMPVLTWAYIFKLLLDRLLSLFFLIVLFPLFVGLALAIRITSGSPVLYRQIRVGRFGVPFKLYKFRTFDLAGKERTPLGLWLRRFSLDELPQLLNVLKGEMSFVGPRPHIPSEVQRYNAFWQRRRFSVMPGLTCYRQILRAEKIPFDEGLALDLRYIEAWSLSADFFLIFKTLILLMRRIFVKTKGRPSF